MRDQTGSKYINYLPSLFCLCFRYPRPDTALSSSQEAPQFLLLPTFPWAAQFRRIPRGESKSKRAKMGFCSFSPSGQKEKIRGCWPTVREGRRNRACHYTTERAQKGIGGAAKKTSFLWPFPIMVARLHGHEFFASSSWTHFFRQCTY